MRTIQRFTSAFSAAVIAGALWIAPAVAGPYTRLQVLLPGESAAPGTTSGKTGTPRAQTDGVPFTVVHGVRTRYREIGADAVVLPTVVPHADIPAIKARSGLAVEVFIRCRAEAVVQGRCALSGYARVADAPDGRPDLVRAGPASSAKRAGRCFLGRQAILYTTPAFSRSCT